MSALLLRQATTADAKPISALLTQPLECFWAFPETELALTPELILTTMASALSSCVGEIEQHVVAFASLYMLEPDRSGSLEHLMVHPSYRGQDVATRMVRHLIEYAFSRHALREVHTAIASKNEPAIMLFSEMGFLHYGTKPIALSETHDEQLVCLRITRQEYRLEARNFE